MKSLGEQWSEFWNMFASPWSVLCLVIVVLLLIASALQTNIIIAGVLTFLLSLLSGALGGIWMKNWERAREEATLVSKGKSAVRSLLVLVNNIGNLEKRVGQHIERHTKNADVGAEVMRTYLEEVAEWCNVLREETVKSIEDWKDMIPEADIESQIGTISELRLELSQQQEELQTLKVEREAAKGSEQRVQELSIQIAEKEKALGELARLWLQTNRRVRELEALATTTTVSYPTGPTVPAFFRLVQEPTSEPPISSHSMEYDAEHDAAGIEG